MKERELDKLVAEHVFGWTHLEVLPCWHGDGMAFVDGKMLSTERDLFGLPPGRVWPARPNDVMHNGVAVLAYELVPDYSTDIAAAWLIVEKLRADRWTYCVWNDAEGVNVYFTRDDMGPDGIAPTAPLAIVLAALKAKGVDAFAALAATQGRNDA